MTPEEAATILQDTLSTPIASSVSAPRFVQFAVEAPKADGTATVTMTELLDGKMVDAKMQDLPVLPKLGWEAIDPAAYKVFASGVRLAASACDLSATLPHDLLLVNVLRIPSLRTAEEVAEIISNGGEALARLGLDDFAREHGLPPLSDADLSGPLGVLMGDPDDEEDAEAAAKALRDENRTEAVPYLLCILEEWQERMWHTGGLSWISEDGRNVDVVLARILEPLLRKGSPPSERERLEALERRGMFDEDHETAMYEWMDNT